MAQPILELRGVSQYFPGIRALEHVDFSLEPGKVHALIGENGAGKSTLVKILTGIYQPSAGQIVLEGRPVVFASPVASQAAGIAAIHQEAVMFPDLSVAENVWSGHLVRRAGMLDWKAMRRRTQDLIDRLGLNLSPQSLVRDLSVAQRHMVEIAKALSADARIVIMDEPTSALSSREVGELFRIVRQLRTEGRTVLFISHRFEEIFEIADAYTVLRDGQLVATGTLDSTDTATLVRHMVGRSIDQLFPKVPIPFGAEMLAVRGFSRRGVFRDVSFSVRRGEIVGLFGLIGAGRSEVMNALTGIDRPDAGQTLIQGRPASIRSIRDAMRHKIAYVPEDRHNQGALVKMLIRDNISLPQIDKFLGWLGIDKNKEAALTSEYGQRVEIKAASYDQKVSSLSGGNQQKVVLAKWLATEPEILILDEPTKGIDIATKSAVYRYIIELAGRGMAIVLVSSELTEILGLSDRVLVMHEGRVAGEFSRAQATSETIMHAATGAGEGEAS
jgi:rhamnose transport system ATP-binding protein